MNELVTLGTYNDATLGLVNLNDNGVLTTTSFKLAEKVREDNPKEEAYDDFLSREGPTK